jgi:hypothetical protein
MMVKTLEQFDERTAAGVLARAALALEGDGNPAAETRIDGEEALRAELLQEGRRELGVSPEDNRPEVVERLGEWLDELSEQITSPPDTQSALVRMAERGDLPSDLYNIDIHPNVADIYRSGFGFEKKLIEITVRAPDLEQHYGPRHTPELALISLFAGAFRTPWPAKDFIMLVAAQRGDGLLLKVNQAWRVYPALVNIDRTGNDLIKLLEQFARVYGADIEFGGERGNFFIFGNENIPPSFSLSRTGKRVNTNISGFGMGSNPSKALLVVAIDVDHYRADLKKMAVREEQIMYRTASVGEHA